MKILFISSMVVSTVSVASIIVYGIVSLFTAGYTFLGCAVSALFLSLFVGAISFGLGGISSLVNAISSY